MGARDSEQIQVELHARNDGKSSGKVIKILSKSNQFYTGYFVTDAESHNYVIDPNRPPMFVSETNGAGVGDHVTAELMPRKDGKLVGKIIQVRNFCEISLIF